MEVEGEDDWGRGRGGRTAVAREGRMVEVRWAVQGKKTKREGGGSKGGGKEGRRHVGPLALRCHLRTKVKNQGDEGKRSGPAGVPLSKALQIPLVIKGITRQSEA